MKYLGCAYYPEYWGSSRLAKDAKLMQEAGINIVRMGEFAWSQMEPSEGKYDFDWLHEAIDVLSQHGIDVMLCTPTATPPAWLTSRYPDTLLVRANGQPMQHGGRRHYCYTSPRYRELSLKITKKLSDAFSGNPHVVAWQLDNEPEFCETGICHCEACQTAFQQQLQREHGTLEQLNNSWKTSFWSGTYSDWSQIRLADYGQLIASSRKIDTYRFASRQLSDFIVAQAAILRADPRNRSKPISTNLNGSFMTDVNYNALFRELDLAYKDLYFDAGTLNINTMTMNQNRSFKPGKPFWITETNASSLAYGRAPSKEQFRAWLWDSYAHGADAYMVFRWRTCLSGQEQELQGILEYAGEPGHRYWNIKSCFKEMHEWAAKLGELSLPQAEVAIVTDYDVKWGYQSARVQTEINYEHEIAHLHEFLYARNVLTDVIDVEDVLEGYKLVILVTPMIVSDAFAEKLRAFVEKGGHVLVVGQIGIRDRHDNFLDTRGPAHVQDVLGLTIRGGMYLFSQIGPDEARYMPVRMTGHVHPAISGSLEFEDSDAVSENRMTGKASVWMGDIEVTSARPLFYFTEDQYKGQPVIVENRFGEGRSVYIAATRLDDALMNKLIDHVLDRAQVAHPNRSSQVKDMGWPRHVAFTRRGNKGFLINHRSENVRFPRSLIEDNWKLIGELETDADDVRDANDANDARQGQAVSVTVEQTEMFVLRPYGICIFEYTE